MSAGIGAELEASRDGSSPDPATILPKMLLLSLVLALAAPVVGVAVAKPQQIRSDQDPVFHYYLQTYPKNSESHPR